MSDKKQQEEECEMCKIDPATLAQLKKGAKPSCQAPKKEKKSLWKRVFKK